MNSRPSADTAHAAVGAEVPDRDGQLLVFALHPPAPASAYERAAGSFYVAMPSDGSDSPLPSRGLRVVTGLSHTGVDDDHGPESTDQESSGLPSPDPSSPGLRTPTDSPPEALALSMDKDDVPDIRHLLINHRAPVPSLSGPSGVAGNAAIGVAPHQGAGFVGRSRPHIYSVIMEVLHDEHDYESNEAHKLFIDTGSDDTFGFGEGIQQITASDKHSNMDLEARGPWSHDDIRYNVKHTAIPIAFDPTLTNQNLRDQGLTLGRIAYGDGAVAHLVLQEPRSFVLHCYDGKKKRQHEIYLTWRFGVAFAVDVNLWKDVTSGMLGLGPTGIQHAYRHDSRRAPVTPPSFLEALKDELKPISRSGEDIAVFFCLRLAPTCYLGGLPGRYPIQSWMSFNYWPCRHQPAWNDRKIVVCNSDHDRRRWAVYLRAIRFARIDPDQTRPVPIEKLDRSYLTDTALVFVDTDRPRGLIVHLDTGASVSYLPLAAVQTMNKNLFMNQDTINVPEGKRPVLQTYVVDPDCWVFNVNWKVQVVYEFEGEGSDPVFVSGPFETFAYQQSPLHPRNPEGLVFPNDPSDIHEGTLGLNFFQTMYVSLHKSAYNLDFVRLAGQWPERFAADLEAYHVAGI